MKIWGVWIAVLLAVGFDAIAAPALGQTLKAVRKHVELSMVVTGSIDIDADGRVEHYSLDRSEKLPPGIVQMVSANLPVWKFAPKLVGGKPVGSHAQVSLRFVASRKDDGSYDIGIHSAHFSSGDDYRVSIASKPSIGSLMTALKMTGATGDVYIALKIGADGKVMDGIVEQVNLTSAGTDAQMERARKVLGERSLDFARHCEFMVPVAEVVAGKPYWSGVLPFVFTMKSRQPSGGNYGVWHAYLPGPRTEVPWKNPDDSAGIDALPDGEFSLDGSGPKLLTPLMQG